MRLRNYLILCLAVFSMCIIVYGQTGDNSSSDDLLIIIDEEGDEASDEEASSSPQTEENAEEIDEIKSRLKKLEDKNNKGLDFSGSLMNENALHHYISNDTDTHSAAYSGLSTLSLGIENRNQKNGKFELDIALSVLYGEYKDYYNSISSSISLPFIGDTAALIEIRKLYLALYPKFCDIIIGRQIVNFGVGTVFSPVDSFSSIDIADISFSRRGDDIAMLKFYFSPTAGLDILSTFSTKMTNTKTAVKLYANFLGFDASLLGVFKSAEYETLLGLSLKGDAFVGIHGEFAAHIMGKSGEHYIEAMGGLDYSFFDGKLMLMAEYYFNSDEIDSDNVTLLDIASIDKKYYAPHYLFFSVNTTPNELTGFSTSVIWNIRDKAAIISGQFSRSITQNADMLFYVQYFHEQINGVDALKAYTLSYALRFEVSF